MDWKLLQPCFGMANEIAVSKVPEAFPSEQRMPPPVDVDKTVRVPTGSNRNQKSPPMLDPASDPGTVPGGDLEPGTQAGPGMPGGGPPKVPPFDRVESIDIIDGKYIPCETPYADIQGEVTDAGITGLSYRTQKPCLNGIYIAGDSSYRITDCEFHLEGHGINDFAGIGAGVMVDGTSKLEILDTKIETFGAIRPCIAANGTSETRIYRCSFSTTGGALPESYIPRIAAGMMEPPEGLKIGGTCRASILLGGAKMYYYDSQITADGWGALSTDSDAPGKYLECNDCRVTLTGSGYGLFGDGSVETQMNRCVFRVKDYISMSGASSNLHFTDCDLESGEYGCMVFGSGANRIPQIHVKGGVMKAMQAAILVKSSNAYITMDSADIETDSALIHSILTDDVCQESLREEQYFRVYGVKVLLQNMHVKGDVLNEDPHRNLALSLVDSALEGAICHTHLSMHNSKWLATADSSVVFVGEPSLKQVDALPGVVINGYAGEGCTMTGVFQLPSGGTMVVYGLDT